MNEVMIWSTCGTSKLVIDYSASQESTNVAQSGRQSRLYRFPPLIVVARAYGLRVT